jgi:uncharacterized membrane protein YeaQ/YmgE (transglycosylase-associated protein family)
MFLGLGLCGCLQCLWVIIVGGAAGFLAGQIIRGKGYGPVGDVLLGMAGFFVGSQAGLCGAILVSFVGALVLILGVRLVLDKDFAK